MIRRIPELSLNVLSQWVKNGYLVPMKGSGYNNGYRIFSEDQFMKARYMAYLIYKVGLQPNNASDIADLAIKRDSVIRERVWVNYNGTMLGIPDLEEQ